MYQKYNKLLNIVGTLIIRIDLIFIQNMQRVGTKSAVVYNIVVENSIIIVIAFRVRIWR